MAGHILLAEDDKALSALMQDFFRELRRQKKTQKEQS